jgi:tetratricopeptide (TPR) repeat protein
VGTAYARAGRYEEAIANYRTAVMLNPGSISNHYTLGVSLLFNGDPEAALAEVQAEPDEGWRLTGLALVYHALGKKTESDAALAELIKKHEKSWSDAIAWVLAYRGETDAAFERMEKAVAYRCTGVVHFPVERLLSSLHDDPRWLPFLHKLGKTPEQLAAIPFEVKLPGAR